MKWSIAGATNILPSGSNSFQNFPEFNRSFFAGGQSAMGGFLTIPTLQQWKSDTELRTPRSSEMKAVDKAIEVYNQSRTPENIGRIRIALGKWAKAKGDGWEQSERNKPPKKPISKLYETVMALKAKLPPDEQAAIRFMIEQQQTLLYRNFQNAKLELPGFNAAVDIKVAKDKISAAASAIKGAGGSVAKSAIGPEVMKAVNDIFGSEIQDASALVTWVAKETGAAALQPIAQHVADMIPFVSLISGGAKVIAQWGSVIYDAYKEVKVYTKRDAIAKGTPEAALGAMRDLLRRETNFATAKATITSAGFAANVGLHAAKGAGAVLAPVVGAAQATAQAARSMAYFGMQVREAILMYKALKNPKELGLDTLNRCPLLGCYMLIGASDSELIAMTWDEFGQAGWMDEVNRVLKDYKPLMDQAADLIQASPFKLTNVPARRATHLSNFGKAKYLASWLL
jgi:hypothetical protein